MSAPTLPYWPTRITAMVGTIVLITGMVVLLGWLLDVPMLKSILPNLVTMKANTALGMVLCGASMILAAREPVSRPVQFSVTVMALITIVLGSLTLGEYFLGWELRIDQLLFRDTTNMVGTSQPGRMSPATAFCFVLTGSALLVAACPSAMRLRLPVLAALGLSVIIIGGLALIGYISDALLRLRWWNYTGMAVHTAAGFIFLGCGLLALARNENKLTWSLDALTTGGFAIGILSLVVAAGISYRFTSQLQQSAAWVSHTQEVLKEIEEVSAGVSALGSSQRNYINTGNEQLLGQEEEIKNAVHEHLNAIRRLDADNSRQQARLDQLEPLVTRRIDWGEETVVARRERGLSAAEQMIAAGEGVTLSDSIRRMIKEMKDEEYSLLDQRQKKEQIISTTTFLLLPLGAFLSLTMLSLGLFFLNADVATRKQAEARALWLASFPHRNPNPIVELDLATGVVHYVNPSAAQMFPSLQSEGFRHPLLAKLPEMTKAFLTGQTDLLRLETTVGESSYSQSVNYIPEIHRMRVYSTDISARKRAEDEIKKLNAELEQRVTKRTVELEAANKELEAFSYSVSHDLRAPLRAVNGFAGIILEDFSSQLPEEGRRYLERIRNGGQRMGELIDDLLAFSHLSRQSVNRQVVNTAKLVRDVLEELKPQRDGRQIELKIGELPSCQGDPALLKQAWVNLLSNALKYSRWREPAVVEISCNRENNENIYFVRDNGTGFDMQYANKLFGVFQRLHRADEFEGTGVGLAIVQRIVHRHGGRVWANAKVNGGATFYFTLEEDYKI